MVAAAVVSVLQEVRDYLTLLIAFYEDFYIMVGGLLKGIRRAIATAVIFPSGNGVRPLFCIPIRTPLCGLTT